MGGEGDIETGGEFGRIGMIDFRHLKAFQTVYQEKNYANAGQEIFANRKSVVRMMQNLEKHFDTLLFAEGIKGELVASAFAERLYNDLRFLTAARQRMKDHISSVHDGGRVLHIGSSAAVFRTREFRNLFRELQSLRGIRVAYSSIDVEESSKALLSGHCDLYIGCHAGSAGRFAIHDTGAITFRGYRRGGQDGSEAASVPAVYQVVSLDGRLPEQSPTAGGAGKTKVTLEDSQWVQWLDNPEECPKGTVIFGPEVQMDPEYWQELEEKDQLLLKQPLMVSFLRQHPYEFLPSLVAKIQNRSSSP